MHEEKSRPDNLTPSKEDVDRDATSKETVSDVKESSGTSASEADTGSGGADNSSAPSPDGQFDTPRDGAGPGDETGPM